jgi:hypothetical protein
MRDYDRSRPLFSLHVPKCAGQSFRGLLQGWYGARLHVHYVQQHDAIPTRRELGAGTCVHGHFPRNKGLAVDQRYPEASQFITVLRDPLETALSNYFFWKRKARQRQIERGVIRAGGEHDYRDVDDFFRQRPRSHILNFLPGALTAENYREFLEERFVWIGLVEDLEEALPVLAGRLGFAPAAIGRINASPRDEELSPARREEFLRANRLEVEIHRYVAETWRRRRGRP